MMREVVIVAAVRTPMGKYGGALKDVRPDDLAALVIREVVRRAGIDPAMVDEVYMGCANQAGEDNRNVARMAAILAGFPYHVAAVTVNRLCASGLTAVNLAARTIRCGEADVVVAGGVESMTRAPWVMPKAAVPFPRGNVTVYDTALGWRFPNPKMEAMFPLESMGETAENIAEEHPEITREEQDRFALLSHQRAVEAIRSGKFREEIVPVVIERPGQSPLVIDVDEGPRYRIENGEIVLDTDLERLSRLPPVFRKGGTVTAGNASGLSDGAAALLLMSAEKARALGLQPMARWVASAAVGVNPRVMGYGPVPAIRKLLERTGLTLDQIDLVEINEAFAVQTLACIKLLRLDLNKVNVNGGAIALGHPLGCSGARILTTLLYEMRRRRARYGMAALCVGVGQGEAALVEGIHA
jgi:3-oxoadipyl-CoA thiolase